MKLEAIDDSLGLFFSLCIICLLSYITGCKSDRCSSNQFQCKNTLCVNVYSKCDGWDDCGDNSDEDPKMCGKCCIRAIQHI